MKLAKTSLTAIFTLIAIVSIAMAWFADRTRLVRALQNERVTKESNGVWVLRCTVVDLKTALPVPGWNVSVDNGVGAYSGPPLADHFVQKQDDKGVFYVCAVRTLRSDDSYPERMGIRISRNLDHSKQSASFLIDAEMWRDGRWKSPKLTHGYPGDLNFDATFCLQLECISEPSKTGFNRSKQTP